MEDTEARALLAELARFATQDRFVYTHVWQKVGHRCWDGHTVMPYDNKTMPRITHQTTLVGEDPVRVAPSSGPTLLAA